MPRYVFLDMYDSPDVRLFSTPSALVSLIRRETIFRSQNGDV